MVTEDSITEKPEWRMRRLAQLLANASVRLAVDGEKPQNELSEEGKPPGLTVEIGQGRMPFGKKRTLFGWVENELEAKWIRRIVELDEEGLSTEKIAKRLNEEDRETRRAGKWSRTAVWRTLKALDKKKGVTG